MKQGESLVKGEQLQLTPTRRSGTQSRGIHGSECSVRTEFLSTYLAGPPHLPHWPEPIQSPEG